jgi:radical SAM protein with 4Fe4S-binding SPASM domain
MKEVIYREFSDLIHRDNDKKTNEVGVRTPLDAMIELTKLCSIKCSHCYIGDARWVKDPNEISTAELKELMDILHQKGTLWLCFTGGEALMRKDFREIWLYAKQKGFLLTLFTNATLIDESLGDFLVQYPPFNIEVSIYGATEKTYELVSQVKGSFRRFRHGLEVLRNRPQLKFLLKTVVMKENKEDLPLMRQLAEELGVEFKFDPVINPSVGKGKSGGLAPCASRMTQEEVIAVELGDDKRVKEEAQWIATAQAKPENAVRDEQLFGCSAGTNSIYLQADGKLQMCVLTGHRGHKITKTESMEQAFTKTWASFGQARDEKLKPDSPCRSCDIAYLCSNCPGFAYLETGSEHSAVQYLCEITHKKAKLLGVPHQCQPNHFYLEETNHEQKEDLQKTGSKEDPSRRGSAPSGGLQIG